MVPLMRLPAEALGDLELLIRTVRNQHTPLHHSLTPSMAAAAGRRLFLIIHPLAS